MHILHDVSPDDCVKICLHKVEHQVDVLVVLRSKDVEQRDDVGMPVELLQENHLNGCGGTSR